MSFLPPLDSVLPSWTSRVSVRSVLIGVFLGFSLSVTSTSLALYFQQKRRERVAAKFTPRPIELRTDEVVAGVTGLIGVLAQVIPFFTDRRRKHTFGQDQLSERCPGG